MDEPVIYFREVYKKFSRGEQHATLRDFIPAMAARLLRKRDETSLQGQEFWAVKDLSFALKRGDSMGIIGPNGSGKSTTLKLLSGILRPDRGTYGVRGRLSALIEVGAGFHPDLTGRENVFLNGSILGMTRKEVAAKFNDIIEIAGVQEFIDTPVKRYSSGMAVRLGFAVAAFVEPEVLLVDEVLAVGDMEFRSRCHARMEQMRKNGVTMILVSHNLNEVRNLCQQTISLFKGEKIIEGPTQKVLEKYYQLISDKIRVEKEREAATSRAERPKTNLSITSAHFMDEDGQPCETFMTGRPMTLRINYTALSPIPNPQIRAEMMWAGESFLATVFNSRHDDIDFGTLQGSGTIDLKVHRMLVEPNVYVMRITISDGQGGIYDILPRVRFVMSEELPVPGVYALEHDWTQAAERNAETPSPQAADAAA